MTGARITLAPRAPVCASPMVGRCLGLFAGLALACCASTAQESAPPQPTLAQQAASAEVRRDYAEAGRLYLELVRREPKRPEWVLLAAENLGRSRSFNGALDLCQTALDRFPDVLDLKVKIAKILHLKAEDSRERGTDPASLVFYYQDAESWAQRVLDVDPKHVEARLLVASSKLNQGAIDEALEVAETLVAERPDLYSAQAMLGQILYPRFVTAKQEGRAEAKTLGSRLEQVLQSAIDADPTRAFPHLRLGDLHAWNGEIDKALPEYREALILDANAAVNHEWLRGQLEPARRREFYLAVREGIAAKATESVRRQHDEALALWYAAQAAFDAEDWRTAAVEFEASRAGLPDFVDTFYWEMKAWFWAEEAAKATAAAVAFAQSTPSRFADLVREDRTALATLASLAERAFNADRIEASRDLNLVLAYAQPSAGSWNNYAFLCRETERFEDSLQAYRRALLLEPDSPQLLNDTAVILQYHLDTPANRNEARQMYRRAILRADEVLADAGTSDAERARARTARKDAKANLRALDA